MAEVICMPKLGFNMDEGQLVRWCKAVGEEVKKGEVLFEINTDKTTMPVEATDDGVLLKTMLGENEYADVFTPIAVVGAAGEDADAALAAYGEGAEGGSAPATPAEEENAAPVATAAEAAPAVDVKDLKLTPKAKKLVKDEGIDPASLKDIKGTGFRGRHHSERYQSITTCKKTGRKEWCGSRYRSRNRHQWQDHESRCGESSKCSSGGSTCRKSGQEDSFFCSLQGST